MTLSKRRLKITMGFRLFPRKKKTKKQYIEKTIKKRSLSCRRFHIYRMISLNMRYHFVHKLNKAVKIDLKSDLLKSWQLIKLNWRIKAHKMVFSFCSTAAGFDFDCFRFMLIAFHTFDSFYHIFLLMHNHQQPHSNIFVFVWTRYWKILLSIKTKG